MWARPCNGILRFWTKALFENTLHLATHRTRPENYSPMTTISKDSKLVTPINVFTVEPDRQQQLVDLLIQATETSMRYVPGFVSANIHRSFDGTKVANYAQWRSVEDFEAMLKNPVAIPHIEQASTLGTFEPGLYEVVSAYPE